MTTSKKEKQEKAPVTYGFKLKCPIPTILIYVCYNDKSKDAIFFERDGEICKVTSAQKDQDPDFPIDFDLFRTESRKVIGSTNLVAPFFMERLEVDDTYYKNLLQKLFERELL